MWDINTARSVAGVEALDTSHDVALQRAMDVVLATVEGVLGRGLLLLRQTVVFYEYATVTPVILLPRWPILQVHSVNGSTSAGYTVYLQDGRLELQDYPVNSDGRIEVDFEGGFDPLPADLEHALWEAFNVFWAGVDHLTGYPTAVQAPAEIEKVVMPDGGSITWDVGAATSGTGTPSDELSGIWGWLYPWAPVLSPYRGEAAPSVAFA